MRQIREKEHGGVAEKESLRIRQKCMAPTKKEKKNQAASFVSFAPFFLNFLLNKEKTTPMCVPKQNSIASVHRSLSTLQGITGIRNVQTKIGAFVKMK